MNAKPFLVGAFCVVSGLAGAQDEPGQHGERHAGRPQARRFGRIPHAELPGDPPGEQPLQRRRSGPPTRFTDRLAPEGSFVQVNVDPSGRNINGDAANEPSIAVDPTNHNRIAIGWRQFDTITSNFREAGVGFSQDGGRTWTAGELESGTFRSDPVLVSDANGTFYYNSLGIAAGFLCDVFTSADGGQTWSVAVPAFGGDKAWMTVDRTNGVGAGNVYTSWSVFAGCCGNDAANRSTDGALSFEAPVNVPQMPLFGTMDVGPDGTVYIGGADPANFGAYHVARSADAQNPALTPTFTTVSVDLGGGLGFSAGPNPGGLLGQVNLAVDPTSGAVYVLGSVDPFGTDPLDIMLARSVDGGATFSAPVRVNDDPQISLNWNWFGTLSVAPNGRIDVVWNDTRESGVADVSRTYYSNSTDGGATWSPSRPLTPRWNSHVGFPNQDKIGDYYDMVSFDDAAHLAFSMTLNGEQDVYYLRIEP